MLSKIETLAFAKMKLDFNNSNLTNWDTLSKAKGDTLEILRASNILRSSRTRLVTRRELTRRAAPFQGVPPQDALRVVRKRGRIVVNTTCISVASIAVLKSLASRNEVKLELEVVFDDVNGRAQMDSLHKYGPSSDFFIAPTVTFMFKDSKVLDFYEILTPCFYQDQYLLRPINHSGGSHALLHFLPESSADANLRFWKKKGFPSEVPSGITPLEIEADRMPGKGIELATSKRCHEILFAWEPLASGIVNANHNGTGQPLLERVPNSRFPIVFSLAVSKTWTHPDAQPFVDAFEEIFIAEWNYCSALPQYAWSLLCHDRQFLRLFGIGAGLDVSSLSILPSATLTRDSPAPFAVTENTSSIDHLKNQVASDGSRREFDVFICYNKMDAALVSEIADQLEGRGVHVWLDAWYIPPGERWMPALAEQIESVAVAAIFVWKNGLGPWQKDEIDALHIQSNKRGCRLIPVVLPDAGENPQMPTFLQCRHFVDFRNDSAEELGKLLRAIKIT
jgi:hypothetical protein